MATRSQLQALLVDLLGSPSVYFQPPPTVSMNYPCIVYRLNDIDTKFANNNPYMHKKRYEVTVIDRDPDSLIPSTVSDLPSCVFLRFYVADQLNHTVFNLYF